MVAEKNVTKKCYTDDADEARRLKWYLYVAPHFVCRLHKNINTTTTTGQQVPGLKFNYMTHCQICWMLYWHKTNNKYHELYSYKLLPTRFKFQRNKALNKNFINRITLISQLQGLWAKRPKLSLHKYWNKSIFFLYYYHSEI